MNAFSPRNVGKFEGLTGPTYKVGGTVHALPPPRALRVSCLTERYFMLNKGQI